MSNSLLLPIKESLKELRLLLKSSSSMMHPRIKMLFFIKQNEGTGISKRALMDEVGVCSQSIQNWRTAYRTGGIDKLLVNARKGNSGKPSVISLEEKRLIEKKLNDPNNGLAGYIELKEWIFEEFKKDLKYNTILKFSIRNFGSSVKVARKSHVKKDELAEEAFKKTSSQK